MPDLDTRQPFDDRRHAGAELATRLEDFKDRDASSSSSLIATPPGLLDAVVSGEL
jgi:hypothetical protein